MDRKRLRLPRSDSGRLILSMAIFTSTGTAASAPTETRAMAVAWRKGRRTLSATNMPTPSPKAVRARASNPSSGICSPVFGMDIERDIAYPYTSRFEKGNGKILASAIEYRRLLLHEFTMPAAIYALILAGGSG